MTSYADFYRRSIDDRDAFWAEQAKLIEWRHTPGTICDHSRPPFTSWFADGTTNLCHNAVDRHLKTRAHLRLHRNRHRAHLHLPAVAP
jgi:propionyl-CoA synthetase